MEAPQDASINSKDCKKELNMEEYNIYRNDYKSIQDFEQQIQILERDIRQQKESSMNAKTSITFEQLKKIYNIAQIIGPQKELFFDRICRAAEIQRASLKNRLKQNRERFDSPGVTSLLPTPIGIDSPMDLCHNMFASPSSLQNIISNTYTNEFDSIKIPANRQFELLQLGFSYDELKQLLDVFDKFKSDMLDVSRTQNSLIMNQFLNYISINSPTNLKLISVALNLLELGNSLRDVRQVINKARRHPELETLEERKFESSSPVSQHDIDEATNREDFIGKIGKPLNPDETQE